MPLADEKATASGGDERATATGLRGLPVSTIVATFASPLVTVR